MNGQIVEAILIKALYKCCPFAYKEYTVEEVKTHFDMLIKAWSKVSFSKPSLITYLPKGNCEQGKLKGAQSGTLRNTTGKSSSNVFLLQLLVASDLHAQKTDMYSLAQWKMVKKMIICPTT